MSFKKQSLIALLLISIGSSIFAMEGYKEPDFFSKQNARKISDKYLGKGNFFRESQAERQQKENRNRNLTRQQDQTIKYEPTIIPAVADIKLSDNAVNALRDLKSNVLDKILANKDLRNEMGLLLPHKQLSRIIGEITTSKKITNDQMLDLKKLKTDVMLNLENPKIFDNLVKRSKLYSQEELDAKLKAYHDVFNDLSNVVKNLNDQNVITDQDLESLKPITELFSERFDNPNELKRSVDLALQDFKLSTSWAVKALDVTLTVLTVVICILVAVLVVFVVFAKLSGGDSGDLGSENWGFFWWQAGRNSSSSNYYTNYYRPNSSAGRTTSDNQSQAQNQPIYDTSQEQTNMQRKKIFGINSTSFNSTQRQY